MSAPRSERSRCVKRGVILTCYLDGRKRFRAVPLEGGPGPASLPARRPVPATRPAARVEPAPVTRQRRR